MSDLPVGELGVVVEPFIGFAWPGFMTIAPWNAGDFYTVTGKDAYNACVAAGIKPDSQSHFGKDDEVTPETLITCYFTKARKTEADLAAKLFSSEFIKNPTARLMRVFYAQASTMIPAGNFDNQWKVPKQTFGGGRGAWQDWSLVTLPSIVAAYAKNKGWEVPELEFREISNRKNINILAENVPVVWDKYLAQRAALWKALGEDKVEVELWSSAKAKDGGPMTVGVTSSDKLSEALIFANSTWKGEFYAAMGECGHPKGKGSIPVCNGLWLTKAEAEAFVEGRKHKDVDADATLLPAPSADKYASLYFPQAYKDAQLSAEEYFGNLLGDVTPLVQAFETAKGPAKLSAKKVLDAKLAEYEQTLNGYNTVKALLG
jgi:hypothetical protein